MRDSRTNFPQTSWTNIQSVRQAVLRNKTAAVGKERYLQKSKNSTFGLMLLISAF